VAVVANAGADAVICPGGSTTIGTPGVAGLDYLWSPGGETTAQILVSPTVDTTYSLEASNACDELVDTVTVTIDTAPAIANAGPDISTCAGAPVQIGTAGLAGYTYSWTPGGATTAQVTVSPSIPTTYTVTATRTCDDATDSVDVAITAPPAAPTLTSPSNGAVSVDPPIVLAWNSAAGATSYLVELADNPGLVTPIVSQTLPGTSVDLGALPVGTYFWRVTPNGTCPGGAASATFSFTVDNVIFIDGFGTEDTTAWSAVVP
jgi:hypothetical protein